jgi:hypothetical protein
MPSSRANSLERPSPRVAHDMLLTYTSLKPAYRENDRSSAARASSRLIKLPHRAMDELLKSIL